MKHLIIICLLASITACAKGPLSIHKIPIQQGNALTVEQLSDLKEGMSRNEVKALLGNPVTRPVFNNNRWDYIYISTNAENKTEKLQASIYFLENKVKRISRKITADSIDQ